MDKILPKKRFYVINCFNLIILIEVLNLDSEFILNKFNVCNELMIDLRVDRFDYTNWSVA